MQGISTWGITLLSANAAEPAGRENVPHVCTKTWASYCLDGTDLSASGVKAIIAVGVIIVVAAITGLCVWLDVRRRSGKVTARCDLHAVGAEVLQQAAWTARGMSMAGPTAQ